jgi:hypothetical protein
VDGLVTVCHEARKGGYVGSHWPKHVRASALLDRIYSDLVWFFGLPPKAVLSFRAAKRCAGDWGAFYHHPTVASLVPACRFDSHAAIMAHRGTNRKPSIGF